MHARPPAPRLLPAAGVLCVGLSLSLGCEGRRSEPASTKQTASPSTPAAESRRYDGLTLDEWRERIQRLDYKSPARSTADRGLREIIRDPDAPWFTRRQAALTLGRIGEPAKEAVADLVALLDEPVDPVETSPPLWALKALALFGPLAVEAAPNAVAILTDVSLPLILRLTCTETLGRIGITSAQAIHALIDGGAGRLRAASSTDQLELRVACIEALQLPSPAAAVPMLMAACEDPAERIRHSAAATLGYLGSRAEPAAELLAAMVVFDESPLVRETAARALAKLGERGAEQIQRLLAQDNPEVQLLAIDAAGRVTVDKRTVAASLRPLFEVNHSLVAARAMDAWWALTRDATPVLTRLVTLLEADDRAVRKSASDTLLRMGSAANPARADLERLVRVGDPESKTAALRVLRALGPPLSTPHE
jgi:HEAT repeat protein